MSGDQPTDATATAISPRGGPTHMELRAFWAGGSVTVKLPATGPVVIGRAREAGAQVDHPSISRRHAMLHLGAKLMVEDLGSSNQTRVGMRVLAPNVPNPLPWGEVFELGEVRAVLCSVGPSKDTADFEALVEKVAASDLSVLIAGETGVGKEVLAERIHARSKRREGPLVRVNCAALAESLLESELFGHERGSFTGAQGAKEGLLELAHGGTFLLDEIGEMPPTTQAKLLRVIETREILRVGSLRPRLIDVRFLAATNRDLDALSREGTFREDLLFRLRGFALTVAPLRERTDEIPSLARLFAQRACEAAGRPPVTISPHAMGLLASYRWPGNVRELRAVMDRAVVITTTDTIDVPQIDFARTSASEAPPPRAVERGAAGDERERILEALAKCAGNQTRAAKMLGMSRRMLVYRLDQLGVERPRRRS